MAPESKGEVLEGSDGNEAALMVPNKGYTGTMWKAIPTGDGFYFLTSAFVEKQGKVLENGDPKSVNGKYKGGPYMQDRKTPARAPTGSSCR